MCINEQLSHFLDGCNQPPEAPTPAPEKALNIFPAFNAGHSFRFKNPFIFSGRKFPALEKWGPGLHHDNFG